MTTNDRWEQVGVDVGIGMTLARDGNFWVVYDDGVRIVDGVPDPMYNHNPPRLSREEALAAARDYIADKGRV